MIINYVKTSLSCLIVMWGLLLSHSAAADSVTLLSSGLWTAARTDSTFVDFTTTEAGETFTFALTGKPPRFLLRLTKVEWMLRPGVEVPVIFSFAGLDSFPLIAIGNGSVISATLPEFAVTAWTHNFTAGSVLRVDFPQSHDRPWLLGLTGSTPTIEAMAQAITDAGIIGLPRPWSADGQSEATTAARATGQSEPKRDLPAIARADAEAQRNRMEASRLEAEKAKADLERARLDAGKARADAERAKAEAQILADRRLRAEEEAQKAIELQLQKAKQAKAEDDARGTVP